MLLIVVTSAAFAQQSMPPFVSRLTATIEKDSIRLTWRDANELVSHYNVYRHDREITADTFGSTVKIGEVEPDVMVFADYPPNDTPYYYVVLAASENDEAYEVFIPFRNKTTSSIAVDAEVLEKLRPITITGLRARIVGEQVVLTYDTSGVTRDITLYRGTQPIVATRDLLNAIPLATITSSQTEYYDTPVAGLDYYYAIFDTELLRIGGHEFVRSENVLTAPMRIPTKQTSGNTIPESTVRNRPLPFLLLSAKLETGEQLSGLRNSLDTPTVALSEATIDALDSLISSAADRIPIFESPAILPGDHHVDGEDTSELSSIISTNFALESWSAVREGLETYLRTRRSADSVSRARFYIGQTLYFESQYREAFVHFLYASENYYAEARPWMDSVLALLRSNN